MKRTAILMFLVILLAAGLAAAPLVMARGSEVTMNDTVFNLDKTAAGTKLTGTMTLFYEITDNAPAGTCEGDYETDMYMFLRLKKGQDFYGFAMGPEQGTCYLNGMTEQREAIEEYLTEYMMPTLFPDTDPEAFAFKSLDLGSAIDFIDPDTGIFFTIVDVVIAVQE